MIGGLYSIQISTDESNYRAMEAAMPVAPNAKCRDRSFTIVKHQNPRYFRADERSKRAWVIRCRESKD
ncbi:hypothetical protein C7S15_8027 [Burkholderia cepacia]|nr:hypothetical protein [Burkholderia cepacia]